MFGTDNAYAADAKVETKVPELGRLKAAAERIAYATKAVDAFLYRFHGPRPEQSAATAPSPPDSYRNDLDTLFEQIMRLEDATRLLEAVG